MKLTKDATIFCNYDDMIFCSHYDQSISFISVF